ncbi:MAG: hypothetical protein JO265_00045 [Acidimicrobiia bacterium]|nr:hypothetical protein [Acidimicrobiia bacterium]
MADVTKTVKDAAYVTVGLGVLAFQKAQVARRDLAKQVEAQLTQTGEQVKGLSQQTSEQVKGLSKQASEQVKGLSQQTSEQVKGLSKKVEGRIQPVLGQLELTLPAQAKDLVKQARTAAESLQGQVRSRSNGRTSGAKKTAA